LISSEQPSSFLMNHYLRLFHVPFQALFLSWLTLKKQKIDGLRGIDIALNFGKLTLLEHSYSIQNWRHWSWFDDLGTICHKIHTFVGSILLAPWCPFCIVLQFKIWLSTYPQT
jgi:hypothetical protein